MVRRGARARGQRIATGAAAHLRCLREKVTTASALEQRRRAQHRQPRRRCGVALVALWLEAEEARRPAERELDVVRHDEPIAPRHHQKAVASRRVFERRVFQRAVCTRKLLDTRQHPGAEALADDRRAGRELIGKVDASEVHAAQRHHTTAGRAAGRARLEHAADAAADALLGREERWLRLGTGRDGAEGGVPHPAAGVVGRAARPFRTNYLLAVAATRGLVASRHRPQLSRRDGSPAGERAREAVAAEAARVRHATRPLRREDRQRQHEHRQHDAKPKKEEPAQRI
mmetsp:Transcript_43488/g.127973  ORF Transcript_43488/g.127973 Transcript_43488/m.127973 type:complete len:287 (+) Transcript_43488:800-1660(+)